MAYNPKSLKNLRLGDGDVRTRYAEQKKQRSITLTDTGWKAVRGIAKEEFGLSVSELFEQIGRGNIKLSK